MIFNNGDVDQAPNLCLNAYLLDADEIPEHDMIWLEERGSDASRPAIVGGHTDSSIRLNTGLDEESGLIWEEYGTSWRCWSDMPTQRQMEAEPW